jgi:hypothetical protein
MMAFDVLFPDLARRECRTLEVLPRVTQGAFR